MPETIPEQDLTNKPKQNFEKDFNNKLKKFEKLKKDFTPNVGQNVDLESSQILKEHDEIARSLELLKLDDFDKDFDF